LLRQYIARSADVYREANLDFTSFVKEHYQQMPY
jgi:hypothetical protein